MKPTKEEILKKIEELKAMIEEPKPVVKRWRTNRHGIYFYNKDTGTVCRTTDDRDLCDNYRYVVGNYFKTYTEAEAKLKSDLELQEYKDLILELNNGEVVDFEDNRQKKFRLQYNWAKNTDRVTQTSNVYTQEIDNALYCLNVNLRKIAVERLGKEKLERILKR